MADLMNKKFTQWHDYHNAGQCQMSIVNFYSAFSWQTSNALNTLVLRK